MVPIHEFGNEATRQKYRPLASGGYIGCFGLTEPNHGSDPGSMVTRAKKVDGGYRLSGSKMWITNSPIADVFVVWARMTKGRSAASSSKGWEGLSAPAIHGKVGLRALDHRRDRDGQRVRSGRERLPRSARPARSVHLPELGALRDLLGRPGRRQNSAGTPPASTCSTASSSAARWPPTN